LFFIYKHTGYAMQLKNVLKNIVCAAAMGIAMQGIFQYTEHIGLFLSLLLTTLLGIAVYIGLMTACGGVTRSDAEKIPGIGRFF